MGLKKYADKLDAYYQRLNEGKAEKITASHVEKVIGKLNAKKQQLLSEIEVTRKGSKTARLERKVLIANEHIKRAELLLKAIDLSPQPAPEEDAPTHPVHRED